MNHKRARSSSRDEYYEVERIVNKRETPHGIEYEVKWKGYSASENTWESSDDLTFARLAVADFEERTHRRIFRTEAPASKPAEDLKVVGVRVVGGMLVWSAEPLAGPPLVEVTLTEARKRAPQALIDYLVSKLRFA